MSAVGEKTLGARAANAPVWPEEPYKGLNFFTAADAPLFTQRDEEIENCAARVDDFTARVLLLHGFSGMGKSSFLRAGLMPRLQAPPEGGCKFFFLRNSAGEPIVVRCTNDPVARIHEALLEAVSADKRLRQETRAAVLEILRPPIPADRKQAAEGILSALERLTDGLAPILALPIDQAEEVLTLPQPVGKDHNRRVAFFYLLEEICHRRLDMRAIVSFRTEYCGRFCSFFKIPPTLTITSAALPRSGLVDFYLGPIIEPERIADIIRLPSQVEIVDKQGVSSKVYGFEFAPGVPEKIAADLLTLSGESSTLPVLQVVCRNLYERCKQDPRHLIDMRQYERIGGVEGALDSYIFVAITGAVEDAGQSKPRQFEIESWCAVLCNLVGQREIGTITSLILSEDRLVKAARAENVGAEPKLVLRAMARPHWRVLRVLTRPGSEDRFYSLGHDCLGGALSRWDETNGVKLKAQKEAKIELAKQRDRYRYRISALMVSVILAVSGVSSGMSFYRDVRGNIESLNTTATYTDNFQLRQRLLMLAASSRSSERWPTWLLGPLGSVADNQLRATLLRAPVLFGVGPAALDPNADKLAHLDYEGENGEVTIRDLNEATQRDSIVGGPSKSEPLKISLAGIVEPSYRMATKPPPVIGYAKLESGELGRAEWGVVVGPGNAPIRSDQKDGNEQANNINNRMIVIDPVTHSQKELKISTKGFQPNELLFPPMLDFGAGRLRLTSMKLGDNGMPSDLYIEPIGLPDLQGDTLGAQSFARKIDWQPRYQAARRTPVFAVDCDKFAFLGIPELKGADTTRSERPTASDPPLRQFTLYAGAFDDNGVSGQSLGIVAATSELTDTSVTIARGCATALVRLSAGVEVAKDGVPPAQLRDQLIVTDLNGIGTAQKKPSIIYLPPKLKGFVRQPFSLQSPPLVATPSREPGAWRVAWQVENGVAVVDARESPSGAEGLLDDDAPFLTGLPQERANTRMTMTASGNFLLVSLQNGLSNKPEFRVLDLRIKSRKQLLDRLTPIQLRAEACRIARSLSGGEKVEANERIVWFHNEDAEQPCGAN